MSPDPDRIAVGVFPAAASQRLPRLLAALEEAFPVRFEGRPEGGFGELDGALELGPGEQAAAAAEVGLPSLALLVEEPEEPGEVGEQGLSDAAELDPRLRGGHLADPRLGAVADADLPAGTVLARRGGRPTWVRAGAARAALLAPRELGPSEALRERLHEHRNAALLPLVHFLRELTGDLAFSPPPARASFLFDDPNLHWPSYGFVRLAELAAHAREHGYHAAMATVPLDAWFAHPAAVRAVRESAGAVSLVAHGNDHYGGELGAVATAPEALALAAQARRRLAAFERRSGIAVEPVMVPPHEECSRATVSALRRCGFEAISMTRPYPWLAPPPRSWLSRPEDAGPLTGWRPADVAEGLPVLLRHPIVARSAAELRLRAFLDQPLILYGHQEDLAEGLGVLADAAAEVEAIGPTRWCSPAAIARTNFETRRRGARQELRLLSRRARVELPADAEELVVDSPAADFPAAELRVDGQPREAGEPLAVVPGTVVEVELVDRAAVDVTATAPPRRRPLALPRRALSESRDRLAPLLSRAR